MPACVNNEYQIYNVNQLKWFRDLVNGTLTDGTERKKNANAKLMADIDLQYEAWTPIGKYDPWYNGDIVYAGTFDGNNHTISNLKVEEGYCSGFFGNVADGHVKNLGIINADLKCIIVIYSFRTSLPRSVRTIFLSFFSIYSFSRNLSIALYALTFVT